jgi:hypothetical protein
MDRGQPLRLVLELTPDTRPISGSLIQDGEPPREFHGTLEMLAAIEQARERAPGHRTLGFGASGDVQESTTGSEGP